MADDTHWIERAQGAEAKLATCQAQIERVKEKLRNMMAALGARELSNGSIDIDFEELAKRLSVEQALELRAAIDAQHRISGEAGKKPRITVAASA